MNADDVVALLVCLPGVVFVVAGLVAAWLEVRR